jgi:hypothetical protein
VFCWARKGGLPGVCAPLAAVVAREGYREYYDSRTGAGMGAHEFGWSTLLVEMLDASRGPGQPAGQ